MRPRVLALACTLLFAAAVSATTFVVPEDEELIAKSTVIAVGTVEGSYVQETEGIIETVYEIRLEQSLKAPLRMDGLVSVVSPGGVIGDRALHVEAAAHFAQGERVLLFLTRHKGRWTTTDLTLGKFRFVTSTSGEELLVRDMEDVVGWDRRGQVHREKVRRRDGFLEFLEKRIHGQTAKADYLVEASEVTLPPSEPPLERTLTPVVNAPFAGATYTSWISNQPTRWPNISAGVAFHKVASQNISGLSDGGVSVIQNGLAAWTNECGSVINLTYGGTTNTPSTNFDNVHVVEFNDPQNRISGSWSGSGTIGICFNSFSSNHSFDGRNWWSITDADVVFQNGFPGTHASFATAMTHELGHGIGWRHSNQNHMTQGAACNSSVEECTSAAIMNSSVSSSYQYTLQPWDINAAQSVYPGGTCGPVCAPPLVTTQPAGATITSGASHTMSVGPTGTVPFTYQWYVGTSGNTSSPISGATGSVVTVSPTTTTSYWVRVTNACGTANSNTATVTVTQPPPPPPPPPSGASHLRTDFDGDGKSDLFFRSSSGQNVIWFMNGSAVRSTASVQSTDTGWAPVAFGDFNGDRRSDIFWRHTDGRNALWLMNGATATVHTLQTVAFGWNVVASGDFNADGRFDVFWRNDGGGSNVIWYMNGPAITYHYVAAVAFGWTVAGAGDFDGNGRYDIFWRNQSSGSNAMWLMFPTGIQTAYPAAQATTWTVSTVGDFNDDGRDDLFWRQESTGANSAWLMTGASRTLRTLPTVASGWRIGAVGDFDGSGTHDVAWHNPSSGGNWMWLMNNATPVDAPIPAIASNWHMYGVK
ncbi:MAG: FG-GAP-like repeat-containing protein [Acidobacteriota bacterium]|nr:FG-GAP-like repeat-containing protein [Acidobacteriota bacterium]